MVGPGRAAEGDLLLRSGRGHHQRPGAAHQRGGGRGGLCLKLRTGEKVWGYQFGALAINISPVVDGNFVYIGHGEENPDNSEKGRIICLDAGKIKDGKPALVWQKDDIKVRYASPIVHDGRLYIADEVGNLHCFDAKTGESAGKGRSTTAPVRRAARCGPTARSTSRRPIHASTSWKPATRK